MSLFGNKESYKDKKSLVIYFSRADENYSVGYIKKGNTEVIAEYIEEIIGADLFKVEGVKGYAADYNTCIEEAKQRQQKDERPELKEYLDDISEYEVIYIGAPVYWGILPQEMVTELERLDFTGKTVRVFTTHEGSGLGSIPSQVKRLCKGAIVLDDGLAIRGGSVNSSKGKVESWLKGLGL